MRDGNSNAANLEDDSRRSFPAICSDAPYCPECLCRMEYEDDRDGDGSLTQRPWWHCRNCVTNYSLTDEEFGKTMPKA